MNNKDFEYSQYLETRKWKGFFYRIFFIYFNLLKYMGSNNIDYGCGVGDFLKFCKFFKKKIIGLDINKINIKNCKNKKLNAILINPNQNYFEDKKDKIDFIVLDNVLEHISQPDPIIRDIYRGLKYGGFLVVGIPVGMSGYHSDNDHKIYYDENKLHKYLKQNNFKKISEFYRPFKSNFFRDNIKQYCYYAVYTK